MAKLEEFFETDEKWRPVVGYEDRYEVSVDGRVRSKPRYVDHKFNGGYWIDGKELSQSGNGDGYLQVSLNSENKEFKASVHRLVIKAHGDKPPTDNHTQVNHIDGDTTNNHIDNLEWATPEENDLHWRILKHCDKNGEERTREKINKWL